MKSFALAALAGSATAISTIEIAYVNYLAEFGKQMNSADEFQTRLAHFTATEEYVREHNATGANWSAGHNQFSDWSREEYKAILGYKRTADRRQDNAYFATNDLPASVDWVTAGAVTPVKNQKACGSCWAFSSTGALEGAHFIASGELLSFSEQQLVSCDTGNDACNGGTQDVAFQYYESHMAELEDVYPYVSVLGYVPPCYYNDHSKTAVDVTAYKNVTPGDVSQIRAAVAQQPTAIAIEADQRCFQNYTSGVLDSTNCGTNLDHAVLNVGYGTENGQDYWLVKNSWGETWGDKGYIKLAIVDGDGICGSQMDPLYPTANQ